MPSYQIVDNLEGQQQISAQVTTVISPGGERGHFVKFELHGRPAADLLSLLRHTNLEPDVWLASAILELGAQAQRAKG